MDIVCGGFTFVSNFDSGNLARVELVSKKQNGKALNRNVIRSFTLLSGILFLCVFFIKRGLKVRIGCVLLGYVKSI
jgi:hypothetical protein